MVVASDWIKLAILVPFYFVLSPLLGVVLKNQPKWQRIAVMVLCISTMEGLLGPQKWGLTLGDVPLAPRSHTKGFYCHFNIGLAIGMSLAKWLEDRHSFRWIPPGIGLYLIYCALSMLSVPAAIVPTYALMGAHKHLIVIWIAIAIFNTVRTEEDMIHLIRSLVLIMVWEAGVCLKLKYMDGGHQVAGTFEHQNSLGMYAVAIGLTLLAVSLHKKTVPPTHALVGFLASCLISVATVSRGTIAAMAAGTVAVLGISLIRKPNARNLAVAGILAVFGAVGLSLTLDTLIDRFERGNEGGSSELREVMIKSGTMMLEDYPQGIGWNNFAIAANHPYPYAQPFDDFTLSKGHNLDPLVQNGVIESHYYMLLAETGYQGLVAWLLVIAAGLWKNAKCYFAFGPSIPGFLSLGIGAGCLLNYAQSTLERVLTQPRNLMMWLIFYAITARLEVMRKNRKLLQQPSQFPSQNPSLR